MAKHNELPEALVWAAILVFFVPPDLWVGTTLVLVTIVLWAHYADMFIWAALILMVLSLFPPDMFVWVLIILAVVVFNVYIVARAARLHRRHGRKNEQTAPRMDHNAKER